MSGRELLTYIGIATVLLALFCGISLLARECLAAPEPDGIQVVEGRRNRTPEEQARRDQLRQQRAARWGIFMHYLIGGLAASHTGGTLGAIVTPFAWASNLFGSWLGFLWTVGYDALILMLVFTVAGLVGCCYLAYRALRWIFTPRPKDKPE